MGILLPHKGSNHRFQISVCPFTQLRWKKIYRFLLYKPKRPTSSSLKKSKSYVWPCVVRGSRVGKHQGCEPGWGLMERVSHGHRRRNVRLRETRLKNCGRDGQCALHICVFPPSTAHCFPGAEAERGLILAKGTRAAWLCPSHETLHILFLFFWFCSDQVEGSESLQGKGATRSVSP